MKIRFRVSEPSNISHVIDSLSAWDIHTNRNLGRLYRAQFGITTREDKMLRLYVDLRRKYRWGKLDSAFVLSRTLDQAYKNAAALLATDELEQLKQVFECFLDNARIMYLDSRGKLNKRKASLMGEVKRRPLRAIIEDVARFYAVKKLPRSTTVHLLLNTCDGQSQGAANIDPNGHVTLQPIYLGKEYRANAIYDLRVVLHEMIHVIEREMPRNRRESFTSQLRQKHLSRAEQELLREAIACTLFPHGFLAVKYGLGEQDFRAKFMSTTNGSDRCRAVSVRRELTARLYRLTANQMRKRKTLVADDYVSKAIDTLFSARQASFR